MGEASDLAAELVVGVVVFAEVDQKLEIKRPNTIWWQGQTDSEHDNVS